MIPIFNTIYKFNPRAHIGGVWVYEVLNIPQRELILCTGRRAQYLSGCDPELLVKMLRQVEDDDYRHLSILWNECLTTEGN